MTDSRLDPLETLQQPYDFDALAPNVEPVTAQKVFCLLSGGVDSSTTLAIAAHDFPEASLEAISFDYGQRHAREIESAQKIAEHYQADHYTLPIKGLLAGMLVDKGDSNEEIPNASYDDLPHGISPTYVSFRNGTMLSLVAARAQAWVMATEASGVRAEATIYCGVHADDGVNWAYPDCTPEFVGNMAGAILIGTYNKVRLRAPLQYYNKLQVVEHGHKLLVPFVHTWSCYAGGELHCGTCPTCRSRKEAFIEAGLQDLDVEYAA